MEIDFPETREVFKKFTKIYNNHNFEQIFKISEKCLSSIRPRSLAVPMYAPRTARANLSIKAKSWPYQGATKTMIHQWTSGTEAMHEVGMLSNKRGGKEKGKRGEEGSGVELGGWWVQ